MQGIMVTSELLGGMVAGATMLAMIGATVRYVTRAEIAKLEISVEKKFATLDENIRTWVNGSFMRAKEVSATLDGLSVRIDHIETNGCARRADHE